MAAPTRCFLSLISKKIEIYRILQISVRRSSIIARKQNTYLITKQCRLLSTTKTLYQQGSDSSSSSDSDSSGEDSSDSDSDHEGSVNEAILEKEKADEGKSQHAMSDVSPEIIAAAEAVADAVPGSPKQTLSDILNRLREVKKVPIEPTSAIPPTASLSDLVSGMKIQTRKEVRTEKPRPMRKSKTRRQKTGPVTQFTPVGDLFRGPRLGIFSKDHDIKEPTKSEQPSGDSLWDVIKREEKEGMFNSSLPRNGFEEMIKWTKEGKMWKFPIDNEQGISDEEKSVEFHEHVFLDHLLEGFPERGPVRHFMELVTNGLSKNPYLTVQMKHDHIEWYRDYFRQKEEMLKDVMGENAFVQEKSH